jgi:hypothetical protein
MNLLPTRMGMASALMLIFGYQAVCSASTVLSPDPRLLSLIPPDTQLIAGAHVPSQVQRRANFVLITQTNRTDFEDFLALTGSDSSRVIGEVIFAAKGKPGVDPVEHSLLVAGHFSTSRIFRSPGGDSKPPQYRGIPVFFVHPLEREREFFKDERLLAIIDSRVAIFGTFASAEQEIDRYLTGAAPDAFLTQRLQLLRKGDETWCLVSPLKLGSEISQFLGRLDPVLGEIVEKGYNFQFGIRYGRRVEFEYVANVPMRPDAENITVPRIEGFSFGGPSAMVPATGFHNTVKISRSKFDKWLGELSSH